jgi:hypothetical protein
MFYFCDEKRLKKKCPKRHAAIDAAVKAWAAPTPAPTPAVATPTPVPAPDKETVAK